jgi:hypothetical protein
MSFKTAAQDGCRTHTKGIPNGLNFTDPLLGTEVGLVIFVQMISTANILVAQPVTRLVGLAGG